VEEMPSVTQVMLAQTVAASRVTKSLPQSLNVLEISG